MAKATIKSKTGAIITVEGTEKEVSNILAQFEQVAAVAHAKKALSKAVLLKREQKKHRTASDLIIELREEGFFNKPKSLTEITQVLEERGHIYPITTLSGLIISLVRKKLFGRKKVNGKWVYGK